MIFAQILDVTTFELPSWTSSDAAHTFFLGMAFAIIVRLFRIMIRWFKRVGHEGSGGGE